MQAKRRTTSQRLETYPPREGLAAKRGDYHKAHSPLATASTADQDPVVTIPIQRSPFFRNTDLHVLKRKSDPQLGGLDQN